MNEKRQSRHFMREEAKKALMKIENLKNKTD